MAARASDEIAALLAAAYRGSSEPDLRRRLDDVVAEAADKGLDDAAITSQLHSWAVQFPLRRRDWADVDAALGDLRTLIVGPQSAGARVWRRLRSVADWVFEHYVAVASLITIIATVFYSLAYARFYQALDITPEQVGLSPTEIVARSALGGVVLTLYLATLVFALILPLVAVRVGSGARSERGTWPELIANVLVFCAGSLALIGFVLLSEDQSLGEAAPVALFPGLVLLAVSFRIRKIGGKRSLHLRPLRFSLSKFLTVYIAFAIPVGLVLTGALTLQSAHIYGERARRGEAVRNTEVLGLPFMDVRAEPALISWKQEEPALAGIPHCVFYLGGSSGDDIFYDHHSLSTFHIPAGEVTVELRGGMQRCEEPVNVKLPWVSRGNDHALVCHPGHWQSGGAPLFSFAWTLEGLPPADPVSREQAFRPTRGLRDESIHCRVSARNSFGFQIASSVATSPG